MLCTKRLEFDAGHRVLGHGGKCRHLHGHRYAAEITVYAEETNKLGFVVDFGCIKEAVGEWIDDNWDHNFLCNADDPLLHVLDHSELEFEVTGGRKPFVMPGKQNPSAENLARFLLFKATELLEDAYHVRVVKVRLYETPTCWSDFRNPYFHPSE